MTYIVEIKNNGRVQLPKKLRSVLNLTDGSKLTFEVQPDFVKVMTIEQQLEEARNILKQNPVWETLSVDDFIQERREEARRELSEMERWDSK